MVLLGGEAPGLGVGEHMLCSIDSTVSFRRAAKAGCREQLLQLFIKGSSDTAELEAFSSKACDTGLALSGVLSLWGAGVLGVGLPGFEFMF